MAKHVWIMAGIVAGCLTLAPSEGRGQLAVGGEISLGTDSDVGVGGRLLFSLERLVPRMEGTAGFNLFFPDGPLEWWEFNGNVAVPVTIGETFMPYVGGGLNLANLSVDGSDAGDDTKVGLNLLAGARFPSGSFTPFLEVRAVLAGADQLVLTGGFLLGWAR